MTPFFRLTLLWIGGCLLAFLCAMNYLPAALVDGNYIPVGNDSFYHARRILDAVANPDGFYEFDRLIHYPEGSWITWPWGYDYFMAQIVRASLWLFGPRDPMAVLDYIPVFSLVITIALVLGLTTVLRFPMWMRALIVLCFAVSPLTQNLHGVGNIDHHHVEHIFILASVLLGILWLRQPSSIKWAASLGVTLGVSVAFHNGLFILQVPLLAALTIAWLRGLALNRRSVTCFAIVLSSSTLLTALPSEPLRHGAFEFFLLSWFQVYIAVCTGLILVLLSYFPRNARTLLCITGLSIALLAPITMQALFGGEFITAQLSSLRGIDEIQSPISLAMSLEGAGRISRLYGLFVWAVPALVIIAIVQVFREREISMSFFWIFAVLTLALLAMQLRFYYYGSIAMYVIPFWCASRIRMHRPQFAKPLAVATCLMAGISIAPSIHTHMTSRVPPSVDATYAYSRSTYPMLANACKAAPGVVLANSTAGHYVRFHSECAVIANNFRLTHQHEEKVARVEYLFSLTPQELLLHAPEIRYVIATLSGPLMSQPDGSMILTPPELLPAVNTKLDTALLMGDPAQLPSRFHRLSEARITIDAPVPITRLYEILPESP